MSTVLITGAGRGLGLELARQYAADAWHVIGTVRESKAAKALTALGANVEAHSVDVTDRKAIARLATSLKDAPIDVLILNAGIYGPKGAAFGTLDFPAWEQVLRVNLLGPAAVAEALVDNVAASERKVIACMSSGMGSIANSEGGDYLYSSSKAALNAIAKAMSIDLAPRGIIVVAMSPGWVRTDMGGRSAPLSAETSVRGLRKMIAGLTPGKSGKFLGHDGKERAW